MDRKLTRRRVLAGLTALGTGYAAAAGTSAFVSDREQLGSGMTAGEVDLELGWFAATGTGDGFRVVESQPERPDQLSWLKDARADTFSRRELVDDPGPTLTVDGVEPGDEGRLVVATRVYDNCAWLWLQGVSGDFAENGRTDVEMDAKDRTAGTGELHDAVRVELWYDDCDGVRSTDEHVIASGTVREVFGPRGTLGPGVLLDGDRRSRERDGTCEPIGKLEVRGGTFVPEGGTIVGDRTFAFDVDGETTTVSLPELYRTDDGEVIGFDASVEGAALCRVDVKGGGTQEEARTYANLGCVTGGSGFFAPLTRSGRQSAVSHAVFYRCTGDRRPNCASPGDTRCLGLRWWLPEDVDAPVQTDSLSLGLSFAAEQRRHTALPSNPFGAGRLSNLVDDVE